MRIALALLMLLSGIPAAGAELSARAQREIAHLIAFAENSGCTFNRNGTWYAAGEVGAHLRKKTDYLLRRDLLSSADDFIAGAASESSLSKQAYRVRCAGTPETDTAPWFRAELVRYRNATR